MLNFLIDCIYHQAKLRGFESGKVGPKDGADYIGGNYACLNQCSNKSRSNITKFTKYNFSIFFDAANVWGIDYSSSLSR